MTTSLFTIAISAEYRGTQEIYSAQVVARNGEKLYQSGRGANDSAASFRMATKSKFGEKEYVEWHSAVAFRELAQEVVEKCAKGPFIRSRWLLASQQRRNDGGQSKPKLLRPAAFPVLPPVPFLRDGIFLSELPRPVPSKSSVLRRFLPEQENPRFRSLTEPVRCQVHGTG